MIDPRGLLLVVPHRFVVPSFNFMGGVAKEYITKLGCEKYFLKSYILLTYLLTI